MKKIFLVCALFAISLFSCKGTSTRVGGAYEVEHHGKKERYEMFIEIYSPKTKSYKKIPPSSLQEKLKKYKIDAKVDAKKRIVFIGKEKFDLKVKADRKRLEKKIKEIIKRKAKK